MAHPLQKVIDEADGFLIIGDSSEGRFPAASYHAYTGLGKRFYCLDLGGLTQSRGKTKGGKVYTSVQELPEDHDDLAVIWVEPHSASRAVDVAREAGCTRIWFSFQTGHPEAVAHARELGLEVVEIGRCPVYYADPTNRGCRLHTAITRVTGTWGRPPQTDPDAKHRELV